MLFLCVHIVVLNLYFYDPFVEYAVLNTLLLIIVDCNTAFDLFYQKNLHTFVN